MISLSQNAFLPGRQIIDCSLVANEYIDEMRKVGREGLICKIDMEKVIDHVNWGYLDWVLGQMGFGSKWRNWIKVCISSPSFYVGEWYSEGFL